MKTNVTEKFLLSLFHLSGLKPGDIQPTQTDTNLFWTLVSENAIEILTIKMLNQYQIPFIIPDKIKETASQDSHRGMKRHKQFNKIIRQSMKKKIKICLLKGSAFGEWIWNDPCYKRMNDTDVLIQSKDLNEFIALLRANGYSTFDKQKKVMDHHHIPPFFHQESGSMIGIHLHIASSLSSLSVETLWSNAQVTDPENPYLLRLSIEHNLLHLCLNLPLLKTGLRELIDIIKLIQSEALHPETFRNLIREPKVRERVFRCLSLTQVLYQNHRLESLYSDFQRHCRWFVRNDTMNRREFLLKSRSTLVTKLERNFLIYKLSDDPWDKKSALNGFFKDLFLTSHRERKRLRGSSGLPGWVKAFEGLIFEHGFFKVFLLFHLLLPPLIVLNLKRPVKCSRSLSCIDSFQFIMTME